uniref:Uncharacterized protein n=1 Tax=Anguilla anguilla TaxID=7936 RepID=A0A0E9RU70_ANGAN
MLSVRCWRPALQSKGKLKCRLSLFCFLRCRHAVQGMLVGCIVQACPLALGQSYESCENSALLSRSVNLSPC